MPVEIPIWGVLFMTSGQDDRAKWKYIIHFNTHNMLSQDIMKIVLFMSPGYIVLGSHFTSSHFEV